MPTEMEQRLDRMVNELNEIKKLTMTVPSS